MRKLNLPRKFEHFVARRERVPVWIALVGASGSGKTFSALRLATGMAEVLDSKVWMIDTEGRRGLHYADNFRFVHVPFVEPFGSGDYLDAVRHCVSQGARVVIIDSLSHEHEGPGGYLATQQAEVERLIRGDDSRRDRVQMLAWAKPSAQRNLMLQGLLQLSVNLVCCFRAKERVKPVKGQDGKLVPTEMGWSAIGGESLTYEMTVSCLLQPQGRGVPVWETDYAGERAAMKLPRQFEGILNKGGEITEKIGANLAGWAAGEPVANGSAEPAIERHYPQGLDTSLRESYDLLSGAAKHGQKVLRAAWGRLSKDEQKALKDFLDGEFKPAAEAFDTASRGA